ncbi:MAG: MBL fold metallo-hydrolase [Gemmatimonadota bacterium]|nr:MBL fold metallo-hydrolase [Gemmatimonadota bacterium]MDH3422048.1 MBL fold metallo-hydrolase [Gemmatimonadota bacterium]
MAWEWITRRHAPDPTPSDLQAAESRIARPTTLDGQVRVTWIGHATYLIQLPGLNLLTDPVWSERASPVPFAGAKRFSPPGLAFESLPPIHGVLLSHDHYDHLDRPTVRALHRRFGDDLAWYTPLGYRAWFGALGVTHIVECDWWDRVEAPTGGFELTAAPARHWTRRTPWSTNTRLWCSWAITPAGRSLAAPESAPGPAVYFGGDSGYAACFAEIGMRLGPFDVSLIPVGAYEPAWFMSASHMNPEEAVQVYRDLGASGAFIPTHWGTFRLTFEDPLEPPERTRMAWHAAGLDASDLRVARHGETIVVAS